MTRNGAGAAAIVVGGAVAKGAFAAGALAYVTEKLQEEGTPIRTLVGTSSGALNATVIAAGVHAGEAVRAARNLRTLWQDRAGALQVFWPHPSGVVRLDGVSGSKRIVELLEEACPRATGSGKGTPVVLGLVTAPLAGTPGPRTSFEHLERFDGNDFDAPGGRARIFQAATASAAFPFVFAPVQVDAFGPCVDGGVVNNTPIKKAIEGDPEIDVVYAIVADPPDMTIPLAEAAKLGGVHLGLRLAEMLIDERLVRDLEEAKAVNGWLDTLERLQREGKIDASTRDEIVRGFYPERDPRSFRNLRIVEVRPAKALEGSSFSGFFSADLRRSYIEDGGKAAEKAWADAKGGSAATLPGA